MLIKNFSPSAQDLGMPAAALIKRSRDGRCFGNDRIQLEKRAGSQILDLVGGIQTHPDEVLIHLIALGSTEKYGANRNGDGFREKVCRDYYKTFEKYARFYRDHLNKNPAKSYGLVKAAIFNEEMSRVELICALNASEAAAKRNGGLLADRELEKLANDQEIPVSMACLTDSTYPILTRDRGYVPISDIVVGDHVWTRNGRWRPVTQLKRRTYSGELRTFRINGLPLPLEVTADHPMFAKVFVGSRMAAAVKAKARRYFTDAAAFDAEPAGWTHAAHVGAGDRFFYAPVTQYAGYGRISDARLAALLGYYVAEGSLKYNGETPSTVCYTCNLADSLPRTVPPLVEQLFPGVTVDIEPKANSATALSVLVNSTPFAQFVAKYCGTGCRGKLIPPEIFNALPDTKLAFLGAWLDGDGWLDGKGAHWSSASRNLVLQGRDLLLTLGIPTSIYKIDHAACATSGYAGSGVEYTLNVAPLDCWQLATTSTKAAKYAAPKQVRTKPAAMRRCPDGLYAYRIAGVTSRYVSDLPTYNFEVADDESYSAAGLISHNCGVSHDICSYCNNHAKTRKDYCRGTDEGGLCKAGGLHRNIGRLVDVDGDMHMLHADNPDPKFFDISHVFRPADRIAYVMGRLEKAAGAGVVSGAELAESLGLVLPYDLRISDDLPKNHAVLAKLAHQLADVESELGYDQRILGFSPDVHSGIVEIPAHVLKHRMRVSHWLKAAVDARMLLSPAAYLHGVCGLLPKEALAADPLIRAQLPGIYGRLATSPTLADDLQRFGCEAAHSAPSWLQEAMQKHASSFSLREPYLSHRVRLASIRGASWTAPDMGLVTKLATADGPSVELARGYAIFKLAFLASIPATSIDLPLTRELVCLHNLHG